MKSSGQNTGVGSLSLLQGLFPTQGSNPGLPHCTRVLYQLSHKGSPRIPEGIPSPGDLPDPRIEPGSPALQADSHRLSYEGSPLREAPSLIVVTCHLFGEEEGPLE